MNLNRRTFISDAVPHAFRPMTATRIIVGGDPGDRKDWRPSKSETEAVRAEAVSELADPEDGIIGLGACMDAATHRPCQYAAECMRVVLAHKPLTCYVRQAAIDERDAEARRRAGWRNQAAMILNHMRHLAEPVTFREVCAALGYAETPTLLKAGWKLLQDTGRIVCVSGYTKSGKYRHRRSWIIGRGK
jgi:hypothetical protein